MKPLKLTMILFSCSTGWRVTWPQHCACAYEMQENPAEIRLTFSQQKCLHNYRDILSGYWIMLNVYGLWNMCIVIRMSASTILLQENYYFMNVCLENVSSFNTHWLGGFELAPATAWSCECVITLNTQMNSS